MTISGNKIKEKTIWNRLKDMNRIEFLKRFYFLCQSNKLPHIDIIGIFPSTSQKNFLNFLENPNKNYVVMFNRAFRELNKNKKISVNYMFNILKDFKLNWYVFDFVDNIHEERSLYFPNEYTPYYLIDKDAKLYIKTSNEIFKRYNKERLSEIPELTKEILELAKNLKKNYNWDY